MQEIIKYILIAVAVLFLIFSLIVCVYKAIHSFKLTRLFNRSNEVERIWKDTKFFTASSAIIFVALIIIAIAII